MKRTIITLIISVLVYIAAYIAADYIPYRGNWLNALVQTFGMLSSVGIVGCIVVLLYFLDEKC